MKRLTGLIAGMMIACTAPAAAATLVDTGTPPPSSSSWSLAPDQSLAAKFTLTAAATIDSVLGFLNGPDGATITIALHDDGGDIPGSVLFSSSFLSTDGDSFQGVTGQSWGLGAGDYWVSFGSDTQTGMGEYAPAALPTEAFTQNGIYYPAELGLGIRITGTATSAVPEPASWLLMIGGFGLAGAAMRRRPVAVMRFA